jgi:hypothetical protein
MLPIIRKFVSGVGGWEWGFIVPILHHERRIDDDGGSATITGHENLVIPLLPEFFNLPIQFPGGTKLGPIPNMSGPC